MDDLCRYANRPIAFIARYIGRHRIAHTAILLAVLGAVGCSVATQYGVKILVDTLSAAQVNSASIWVAFGILVSLVAGDNFLAGGELDREPYLRSGDRRSALRTLPDPDGPRPAVFPGSPSRR